MYAEIKQKIQIIKQYICTLLEKQMESEEWVLFIVKTQLWLWNVEQQ
jgi:hypothetical protein